ncbi:hypothetical protein [Symbioplanes lichenis]|uniref:hypothetical protein n=1 Tax=Symbioplanes lichenis TaxID=1629072 RepID=UPI0027394BC0|nr:hypothetical protein [Actinoplanes lichenis]
MAISYDYPNKEAIDAMGILTKYDKDHGEESGWARSVIDKIQNDISSHTNPRTGMSTWDRGDYSKEELAVYDWYKSDVIEKDHWDKLVENYQGEHKPEDVHYKEAPPSYTPPKDSDFKAPETSTYTGGDNNPNNEMAISTEAIDHLIKQIDTHIVTGEHDGILLKVAKELEGKHMKPGGFAKAEIMRQKIDGVNGQDAGLRGDAIGLLGTLHAALFEIREGLSNMKEEYKKAEDFNAMTSEQLAKTLEDAWSEINALGNYGKTSGTNTGGANTA